MHVTGVQKNVQFFMRIPAIGNHTVDLSSDYENVGL